MFQGCNRLRSVNAPHVVELKRYAFFGLSSLATVNFPSVQVVRGGGFEGTTSLCALDLPSLNTDFSAPALPHNWTWHRQQVPITRTERYVYFSPFSNGAMTSTNLKCFCYPPDAINEATNCHAHRLPTGGTRKSQPFIAGDSEHPQAADKFSCKAVIFSAIPGTVAARHFSQHGTFPARKF